MVRKGQRLPPRQKPMLNRLSRLLSKKFLSFKRPRTGRDLRSEQMTAAFLLKLGMYYSHFMILTFKIVVVACVRSMRESATGVDYVLEDGTASISGKCWQDKCSTAVG